MPVTKRLFEVHDDGSETWFHYDSDTDTVTLDRQHTDVSPLLDQNAAMRNDSSLWTEGMKKGMVLVASIPNIVLALWKSQGVNIADPKAVRSMLRKPEWKYLKTTEKEI